MMGNTRRFFDVPRGMAQLLLGVVVLSFPGAFISIASSV